MTEALCLLIGLIIGYGLCFAHFALTRSVPVEVPKWTFPTVKKEEPDEEEEKKLHVAGPPDLNKLRQAAFALEAERARKTSEDLARIETLL